MVTVSIPLWGLISLFVITLLPNILICISMLLKHLNDREGFKVIKRLEEEGVLPIVVAKKHEEEKGDSNADSN